MSHKCVWSEIDLWLVAAHLELCGLDSGLDFTVTCDLNWNKPSLQVTSHWRQRVYLIGYKVKSVCCFLFFRVTRRGSEYFRESVWIIHVWPWTWDLSGCVLCSLYIDELCYVESESLTQPSGTQTQDVANFRSHIIRRRAVEVRPEDSRAAGVWSPYTSHPSWDRMCLPSLSLL